MLDTHLFRYVCLSSKERMTWGDDDDEMGGLSIVLSYTMDGECNYVC